MHKFPIAGFMPVLVYRDTCAGVAQATFLPVAICDGRVRPFVAKVNSNCGAPGLFSHRCLVREGMALHYFALS